MKNLYIYQILAMITAIGFTLLGLYKLFRRFLFCHRHGWFHFVRRFRMNTAYVEEAKNWATGCEICEAEAEEYWKEQWEELYGRGYKPFESKAYWKKTIQKKAFAALKSTSPFNSLKNEQSSIQPNPPGRPKPPADSRSAHL